MSTTVANHDADPEPSQDKAKKFFESDAGDGTHREDMYLTGVKLFSCILALFVCLFLYALDQLIVATILSTVGNKFHSTGSVGWLTSGFLISMSVLVLVWGKISIIFGRKWAMVASIVLFEAGSLMCALSNDMNTLIGGRVLAGVGGGGIQTLVFIIITEILPIQQRPFGMALISCNFALASVLGPLVGGAFTSNVSWRWCFYINLPLGAVALAVFIIVYNPPFPKGDFKKKLSLIDYPGMFLAASGLVLLLVALTFGAEGSHAWDSGATISCFVLGGILVIAFAVWNLKYSKRPLLPKDVAFAWPTLAAAVEMFGTYGYFISSAVYLAIYFQVIHDASAWHSGLDLLPLIIAVVVTSIASAFVVKKSRFVKPVALFGIIFGFVGCGLVTLLDVDSSEKNKIGLLICMGIGVGAQFQPSIIAGQISAPKTPGATIMATTLINFFRSYGGALAGTLADVAFDVSYRNLLSKNLSKQSSSLISELDQYDLSAVISSPDIMKGMSSAARAFLKKEIMQSIRNVFYMNFAFAVISVAGGVFLTNKRLPRGEPQERDSKSDAIESAATEKVEQSSDLSLASHRSESGSSTRNQVEQKVDESA